MFPFYRDLPSILWKGNLIEDDRRRQGMVSSMDATLFHDNMRGWQGIQDEILGEHNKFMDIYWMSTAHNQGILVVCKSCRRCLVADWEKKGSKDRKAVARRKIRDWFGWGTQGPGVEQPML